MDQPTYTIAPRGNLWRVLKWEYTPNGSKADVLFVYFDKEKARKKLKELYETDSLTLSETISINRHR